MTIFSSPPYPPNPRQNHLLAALPEDEYGRLLPHLERVSLPLGKTLSESGNSDVDVYFPHDIHRIPATRAVKWFIRGNSRRRQ